MADRKQKIFDTLAKLTNDLGVEKSNLYGELGEELREVWSISEFDTTKNVKYIVISELERLIEEHVKNNEDKFLFRILFNIADVPEEVKQLEVTYRIEWANKLKYGSPWPVLPSVSTVYNRRKKRLPDFARDLLDPPTREDIAARVRQRFGVQIPVPSQQSTKSEGSTPSSEEPESSHRGNSQHFYYKNALVIGSTSFIGTYKKTNMLIAALAALVLVTGTFYAAGRWYGNTRSAQEQERVQGVVEQDSEIDSTEAQITEDEDDDSLIVTLTWMGQRGHFIAFPEDKSDVAQELIDQAREFDFSFDPTSEISQDINPFQDVYEDFYEQINQSVSDGGYHTNSLYVRIEVEGRDSREITIFDVRPVIVNRSSLPNSLLFVFLDAQGDEPQEPRNLWFPMDDARPLAREGGSDGPPVSERPLFFDSQRIGLQDGSKETLVLSFDASVSAVEFGIAIDYEVNGEKYTEILKDDDGEDMLFRVAGRACSQEVQQTEIAADEEAMKPFDEAWAVQPPMWELESQDPQMYCSVAG